MAQIIACADGNVQILAGTTTAASTDALTGTQYPVGTPVYIPRCVVSMPTIIDTQSIEQVAHPVMDSQDFQILGTFTVTCFVIAFGIKMLKRVVQGLY